MQNRHTNREAKDDRLNRIAGFQKTAEECAALHKVGRNHINLKFFRFHRQPPLHPVFPLRRIGHLLDDLLMIVDFTVRCGKGLLDYSVNSILLVPLGAIGREDFLVFTVRRGILPGMVHSKGNALRMLRRILCAGDAPTADLNAGIGYLRCGVSLSGNAHIGGQRL